MKVMVMKDVPTQVKVVMETCGCEQCGGGIPRPPDTCCESVTPTTPTGPSRPVDRSTLERAGV